MEQTTRRQNYRYQTKTVSMSGGLFTWIGVEQSNGTIRLQITIPDDLVELVGLFTKVIIDANDTSSNGSIVAIGPQGNMVQINKSMVNGKVELDFDFSYMIDKFDINNGLIGSITQPFIEIDLQLGGSATSEYGKVKLWKADMTYTTVGTR